MVDLTRYTFKDMYTGKSVRASTAEGLREWLVNSYKTLTAGQQEMIRCLVVSFENEDDHGIKWYGVACGLEITQKKRTRRKTK